MIICFDRLLHWILVEKFNWYITTFVNWNISFNSRWYWTEIYLRCRNIIRGIYLYTNISNITFVKTYFDQFFEYWLITQCVTYKWPRKNSLSLSLSLSLCVCLCVCVCVTLSPCHCLSLCLFIYTYTGLYVLNRII